MVCRPTRVEYAILNLANIPCSGRRGASSQSMCMYGFYMPPENDVVALTYSYIPGYRTSSCCSEDTCTGTPAQRSNVMLSHCIFMVGQTYRKCKAICCTSWVVLRFYRTIIVMLLSKCRTFHFEWCAFLKLRHAHYYKRLGLSL